MLDKNEPGVGIKSNDRVYLTLRTGSLCEVAKSPRDGFREHTTEYEGKTYTKYVREYDWLTGHITDVRRSTADFGDGKTVRGLQVTVEPEGSDIKYVLDIKENERPYKRLISTLCNINFDEPVRFEAFLGRGKGGHKNKVLLLYQGGDINPDTGKERPVQPKYPERWLSRTLVDKLKQNLDLTDQEKWNVAFDKDGKPDNAYPYIREGANGKWLFETWDQFLEEKLDNEIIPAVQSSSPLKGNTTPFTGNDRFDVEDSDPDGLDPNEPPF